MINRDYILEVTSGGEDVYRAFIGNLEPNGTGGYKPTFNPCYEDTKPGLSVYYDRESDRYRHYDHGDDTYKGDCFDFIGQLYHLDPKTQFQLIMDKIAEELGITLASESTSFSSNPKSFEIEYASDEKLIEYFMEYGVSGSILKQYNVHAVKSIKNLTNGRKHYQNQNNLLIAYQETGFAKFYQPSPKKFWFVGKKEKDFVFGQKEIIQRSVKSTEKTIGDTIIISGGEKDVLTLTALGYDAVCLNSETASVPAAFVDFLSLYDRVLIMYDIDTTGKQKAQGIVTKFQNRLNIHYYELPETLKERGGKDISDYVKLGLDKDILIKDIDNTGRAVVLDLKMSGLGNDNNNEIERSYLPDTIFQNLPQKLKIAIEQFAEKRYKDLVLLSSLGVLSSLFPTVYGEYGGHKVGCNLFLLVTAPAASGKGAMTWARNLGTGIQQLLEDKFLEEMNIYQIDLDNYKNDVRNNPSIEAPIKPRRQTLFIPANTSTSKMIELIGVNNGFGIIFQTEADTLTKSLNSEWGDFSDILRNAFHHEPISMARRGNNEFVEVENPHLSVVLSGTPNQLTSLIGGVENGFFSRFIFYDFRSQPEWQNQFLKKGKSKPRDVFKNLSEYFADVWIKHEGRGSTDITLTGFQEERLNQYFDDKFRSLLQEYGDDIAASVKRAALVCYRLAMILTALRALETSEVLGDALTVNEADFLTAMAIIDAMLKNLETVFSKLKQIGLYSKMNNQQKQLFTALPKECTTSEFDNTVLSLNYNSKTGEKYRKDFIKMGVLERVRHGFYRKTA